MKKTILALVLMVVILSACNLPTGQSKPDASIIATRVAATMAAAQTATLTQSAEGGSPSAAAESATPSVTPTETATPTPTTSPEDPKLTLGSPDFWFNSASSGDPFGVVGNPYDDDAVTISNQVGGLNFTSKVINNGKRWRLTSPTPTDFYLEGTFKVVTCAAKDNYGLVMRVPTYNDSLGYFIGLSCDGNYIVDRLDLSGNGESITGWISDPNIKTGENQINRLGVMLIGSTFTIYINGVKVTELSDSTITNKGHVGAYVSARGKANFTVILQELMEWNQ